MIDTKLSFELKNERLANMGLIFQADSIESSIQYVMKNYPGFSYGSTIKCLNNGEHICLTIR
ncbi:hypothetical protein [Caldalkalibacillus mannanilyticus]|uniref:hypothetical protein n=1 Tax=Caldalkalibacillus mannanilyticus TaxID=1418 RepID=UPI000468DF90|nr:hypothetical protein [Caldalkalibacillus mannanilyticus]